MNLKDLPLGAKFSRKDYQCTPYIKVSVQSNPGGLYGLTPDNTVAHFPGSWEVEWIDRPKKTFGDLKVGEKFEYRSTIHGRVTLTKIDPQWWKLDDYKGAAIDEKLRLYGVKPSEIVE